MAGGTELATASSAAAARGKNGVFKATTCNQDGISRGWPGFVPARISASTSLGQRNFQRICAGFENDGQGYACLERVVKIGFGKFEACAHLVPTSPIRPGFFGLDLFHKGRGEALGFGVRIDLFGVQAVTDEFVTVQANPLAQVSSAMGGKPGLGLAELPVSFGPIVCFRAMRRVASQCQTFSCSKTGSC